MSRAVMGWLIAGLAAATATSPAQAITAQAPPKTADGGSVLVDPDARLDEMVDQRRVLETRDVYDPGRAASVLRFGDRPSTAGGGAIRRTPVGR